MFRTTWAIALIAALAAIASPACAQRDLGIPVSSGWKHAETGLILRATIAGMTHGQFTDNSRNELDVMAQYASSDGQTQVTFYLFRPALDSVPVWFDRSETMILMRDTYGKAAPFADPLAFARPGAATASALRRVYVPSKGPYRSTGLAMIPMGKWLVAVRVSSQSVEPAQLDALMGQIVAGIGWPQGVAESPAAAPVLPCAQPLDYARRARLAPPGIADALMGGTLVSMTAGGEGSGPPPVLCRDLPSTREYGVYRNPALPNAYTMAVGDAGIIISITPAVLLDGDKPGFRMTAGFLDHHAIYSTFDKLPAPGDVMQAVRTASPAANVSLDGKTIEINGSLAR